MMKVSGFFRGLFVTSVFGVIPAFVFAQSLCTIQSADCLNHCCPIERSSHPDQIVNHHIFILANNQKTKYADWVAYVVDKKNFNGPKRRRNWKKDPFISEQATLIPGDYRITHAYQRYHYDRGHLAPLASFSNSADWYKTNYFSNITPQKVNLNRGPWVKLEAAIRRVARRVGRVYVITGTLYDTTHPLPALLPPRILHDHRYQLNTVTPTAYWKVIAYQDAQGKLKVSAFILPQTVKRRTSFCVFETTLNHISHQAHLRLFPKADLNHIASLSSALGC